ncbi:MAG: PatB family C-S lyase [Bacteroidota bacterium]
MKIDKKNDILPLIKSNPKSLIKLFGSSDITPMWVADMEFEVDKSIQEALINRITNSGFAYEYKPESFFMAQKNWYKTRYQIDLTKEHIVYSPSITTTIAIAIESLTSEKDGIIIQPPVFMEFKDVIRKMKRRIVKNPLKLIDNKHYVIDFENLAEKAKLDENKVLILCNPHNPVGRVWTKKELERIINICKENDLLLISDEIHKDIILFGNEFTSVLNYVDIWDKIIVCTSEAKTFNLCAISDSMAIIPNQNIRRSVLHIIKKYNLGRTNALTRVALETAYTSGSLWLKELVATIENNVKRVESELTNSKINLIYPEGTYQVWLDFRNIYSDSKEMFTQLTKNAKVGMNAGHWYGREGALFMRMNIATSNENVVKSIRSIKNAVLS